MPTPSRDKWIIIGTAGTLMLGAVGLYLTYKKNNEASSSGGERTPPSEEVPPPLPPRPTLVAGDKVLLIGDSIGVGLEGPLRKELGQHGVYLDAVVKTGASIQSTKSVAPMGGQYALVLISLGTNDAARQNPLLEMPDAAELFGKLVGAKDIVWVYPPAFAGGTSPEKGKEAVEEIFRAYSISAAPITAASVMQDPSRLHPAPAGYLDMARQLTHVYLLLRSSSP